MSEEPEDIGHEVEQAFVESENHAFGDIKLQPFTPDRVIAAQAMGLHYGNVDPAGVEQFDRTKLYPGAMRDVAVVLWLCTLTEPSDVDGAARNPVTAAVMASTWAGKHGLTDQRSQSFWDGYLLFFKIMREIEVSRTEPEKKTEKVAA